MRNVQMQNTPKQSIQQQSIPKRPTPQLKAFTIREVTISMLVAAIVIGIAYTTFNLVSKSYLGFKTKNQELAILTRVDQLFNRDFEQASLIQSSNNTIIIYKTNQSPIWYEINPANIIRRSVVTDTFKVQTQGLSAAFEGKTKNANIEIDESDNPTESGRIDELSFTMVYQNEQIPCHYTKTYSSVDLIERKTNAQY